MKSMSWQACKSRVSASNVLAAYSCEQKCPQVAQTGAQIHLRGLGSPCLTQSAGQPAYLGSNARQMARWLSQVARVKHALMACMLHERWQQRRRRVPLFDMQCWSASLFRHRGEAHGRKAVAGGLNEACLDCLHVEGPIAKDSAAGVQMADACPVLPAWQI